MLTNSPSCLDNYIVFYNGCYGDDTPVPTSGYYIENLEGLTIENVAMITPELLISATQTIKEKMLFAASIVENRLKAILNSRGIKLNTLGKLYSACVLQNSWDLSMPFDKGIEVSIQRNHAEFLAHARGVYAARLDQELEHSRAHLGACLSQRHEPGRREPGE